MHALCVMVVEGEDDAADAVPVHRIDQCPDLVLLEIDSLDNIDFQALHRSEGRDNFLHACGIPGNDNPFAMGPAPQAA